MGRLFQTRNRCVIWQRIIFPIYFQPRHVLCMKSFFKITQLQLNQNLSQVPSPQEIYKAACDLSTDSAPGMDGFTGHFFKGCWDIIQHDMVEMIHGFFMGDYLQHRVTLTALTLIPKVRKPRSLADYRPISLSTFASKVVSKILATRLSQILPLVTDEQFGFVRGRSIHESIALA